MNEHTITPPLEDFKAVLLHSWHLLPPAKQQELIELDIFPRN
ncbi:MAG: hypothetical protein V1725_03480 [archaeon]